VKISYEKIYALLVSISWGKTTLLRLILGRIKPKTESICVLGLSPRVANSLISYMPQEWSLCLQFTVNQTFQYFVRVYRLSHEEYTIR
jgi:ABC-type multidrug transport system ATPase subunit